MHLTLDRNLVLGRIQLRWIGFPVLVLGYCAFLPAASGQAQLGTGESSFGQGPDKVPARIVASLPAPPAALPATAAKPGRPAGVQPAKAPAKTAARSFRQNARGKSQSPVAVKTPGDTLTAQR